jgi:hypothetical protein
VIAKLELQYCRIGPDPRDSVILGIRIRNANPQFRILHCHYLYNDVPGPGLVGGVDNLADKGLLLAPLVRVHNARHPLVSGSKMVNINIMNNQSDTVGNNEKWLVFKDRQQFGNSSSVYLLVVMVPSFFQLKMFKS